MKRVLNVILVILCSGILYFGGHWLYLEIWIAPKVDAILSTTNAAKSSLDSLVDNLVIKYQDSLKKAPNAERKKFFQEQLDAAKMLRPKSK